MSLSNIRIVLVGPMYGGNVGSVCRAMKNMGLSDLAVVEPAPTLDMVEARSMACSAGDILRNMREFPTVEEAVADCGLVAGTTARTGLYRDHAKTPREWAPRLLAAAADGPAAILFGREDRGLKNEEIALCTQLIQIPSHPDYPSLNLAQAVMICCYELYAASGHFEPAQERTPEAPSFLREKMFELWRIGLLRSGFMNEEKADHMMMGVRRIFSRGPLSQADLNILMGMARQLLYAVGGADVPGGRRRRDAGSDPQPAADAGT